MDLAVEWGQVHALLGENGAGKSTLMNVVYGLVRPDAGEIQVRGERVEIHGPQDAIKLGIGMVHQHFMLIPPLTVAENVILGREAEFSRGLIDLDKAYEFVRRLSTRYGLEVDPKARIENLSVGVQQRVEILKALYRDARILILDEPTAVLTPQETEGLFQIIRNFREEGSAVIFITHKLGEVMEVADKITVMRRGQVVATTSPSQTNTSELARMMVGRPVLLRVDKKPAEPGPALLEVDNLTVLDDRRQVAVDGVSVSVRSGEIMGVAGVDGNGQDELVEALLGLRSSRSGSIRLLDRDITGATTSSRLHAGLGLIPADRQHQGVILELPISDNFVLADYAHPPFARWIVRQLQAVRQYGARLIKSFDIRSSGPDQAVANLSGGNQQKVVVARELAGEPKVLVAAQPTRGVDVGSIEFIHRQLVEQRDRGLAVLLVSSELDEVLSLADRVAVIYRGRLVAILEGAEIERERIGLLMAGAA